MSSPQTVSSSSADPTSSRAPLAGVRVLELGSLIAGPFATRLLSDFGAEVIKIEAPRGGDPMRDWGAARHEGRTLWWPVQSRGKRLITLDLGDPRGQQLVRRLIGECDVLVENFRPGTMEKWGLGPADLEQEHPHLIYTRVSGYGQTGPYANRPGFASAGEAMGGLRFLNGFPGEAPPRMGLSIGDSLSGLYAALGVLTALYHRDVRGGEGQVIDASIVESCFSMLESVAPEYQKLGVVRGPTGTTIANNAPSNIYRSRDGRWVVISANADRLWRRLATVMDRAELADDERYATHDARSAHAAELDELIGAWAAERDAADIDEVLTAAGVVCSPVYSIADIFEDPHCRERGMLVPVEDPELGEVLGPAITPKLSKTPGRERFTAPLELGEHNHAVYHDLLGIDEDELAGLREAGVV